MRPLRIAVLLKTNQGGLWIIPQVEELRRRGHEVVMILPPGAGRLTEELRRSGFEVRDSPFDFRFRPGIETVRGLWRLRQLARRLRLDVLNYHLYASALAARFATVGLPLRRVHMVAGPLYLESRLIRAAERLLWRLDSVTICGTGYTSRLYGALGCPADRRPVKSYGARTAHFAALEGSAGREETRAKARAELGIEEDVFVVIMVAYVYPPRKMVFQGRGIKGHDVLLTAWQAFHELHPRSRLLLVGAGFSPAGEAHRQELVRQFHLDRDDSVSWLTSVADVRDCYRAADVSVSPSLSEGHGAACEASASGVPCIVSDAGGLPETVDETTGWVVPRGDATALGAALRSAYREFVDGDLRTRGERAQRFAIRHFDNRTTAVGVADIVEAACGTTAGRP
ncbi:glycosyltransferase family 4 protein [Micromonospora halotolerans]|uniref:Glycosyltransferase family 4 protein n=1 Tax=Micromonospora halotolerans TaxID=709879 RepID=A0ABY9ZXY8_9ACTN|nr:glycosyltransferase family 4 protein [Micromonospora halotolerans]WNM40052.1 glycosyltransferase family 4 protein [Micromonospora halotolerans]